MKNLPKIVLNLGMSVFLTYQSWQLIYSLPAMKSVNFLQAFGLGFLFNLFILGIFAFAGFALPTSKLLPENFYKVKNGKRLKALNSKIGVEGFRKFLLMTFWKDKNKQTGYFNGKKSDLKNLEFNSKQSEFGHLIPFGVINFLAVFMLIFINWKLAFWTFALNIFANLYPVLLQRDHRRRIAVLVRRYAG